MSTEGINSSLKTTAFEPINKDGTYVMLADLPKGARGILFNTEELRKAKEEALKKQDPQSKIENPLSQEELNIIREKQVIKEINELSALEAVRNKLANMDSYEGSLNEENTNQIAQEKMKLKEALTGIKQQTAEIINPQKALEANKPVDNNENNKIKIQDSEFLYEKRLMGALASLTDGEFVKQFGPDCTIDDKGYIVKGDGTRTNLKPSMLDYHAEIKKNDGRNPEELRQSIKDEIEWENSSEIKTSEDKELIETVAMSNQEGSKSKVEEKEEVKSNPHEVANDIVLEPNKDKPQKIEIKELPEEWKRFDKAWFSNYVPNEYEYLDIAQKVKNFSENLADHDEVFRKMLSEKIFENEKYNSLSEFIGINEEGRLVNRNGAINNFPHMLIGFSPRRAEYEQKLVQAYAKEKGYL